MIKIYYFEDLHDFQAINRKLSRFGITIQRDLFGAYAAYVEEPRLNSKEKPNLKSTQIRTSLSNRKNL